MAKPRYSYTFTLDTPEAEDVDRIAHDMHLTPTGAAKRLFLERLELEHAGWKLGDDKKATAVEAVVRLNDKKFSRLVSFLREELQCQEFEAQERAR